MGKIIREFVTQWGEDDAKLWFERDEDDLIGTRKSGGREIPRIRVFDLIDEPTNTEGSKAPVLWSGEDGIVEAHHIVGPEPHFHRPADFDVLIFQYSGVSAIESEMGEFKLAPGHVMHVPAGAAYRVIGSSQCRQIVTKVRDKFETLVDPNRPTTETVFNVDAEGSNAEAEDVEFPDRNGKILEVTEFWDQSLEPLVIERTHASLVGCMMERSGRRISVIRAFDYFCGITGQGGIGSPNLFSGVNFKVEVYNTQGQQHGFHRGLDGDEIWFQFRGHGKNDTEWGVHELESGEIGYSPRGIAHRITGDEQFLRLTLYFHSVMQPRVDESDHKGNTTFVVDTVSSKKTPVYAKTKARIDAALARGERPSM